MSMHRYFLEPRITWGPTQGRRSLQYVIRDKDQILTTGARGAKVVAWIREDAELANRILNLLNGTTVVVGETSERWQRTFDHANNLTAVARRERDEARDELAKLRASDAIGQFNTAAIGQAATYLKERDAAEAKLRQLRRDLTDLLYPVRPVRS